MLLKSIIRPLLVVALCATLTACDSADPDTVLITGGVVVTNQGNFSEGTGSITVYDPGTGLASQLAANFGSVLQSTFLKGDSLYIMANSASRIDILDVRSGARIGQISDVISPRYMTATGNRAFVTNLFSSDTSFVGGAVTILDLQSSAVIDTMHVGNNPEGLAIIGPRLWVADNGFGNGTTLTILDHSSGNRLAALDIGCFGPRFITVDDEAEMFVLCTGTTIYDENFNPIEEIDGQVAVLDGATGASIVRIPAEGKIRTAGGVGQDMYHSPETQQLFFVRDAATVVRINTLSNAITTEFTVSGDPIGAVAFDHIDERLYLGRVTGFDQTGYVSIHDTAGVEVGRFDAGIAPSHIVFAREEQ
ncbi:MAG: hypothetical protein HKN43_10840 [Rhodothermales bacterium]|nr:hypothetical protein [Rhodothermales bacterium]